MTVWLELEKIIFYVLVFLFFVQTRLIWRAEAFFNEWTSFYIYVTDFLIVALILLWFWRRKKNVNWRSFFKDDFFTKPAGALILFLVAAGLSVIIAQNKAIGIYGLAKLLEFALLFLYVKNNFVKLFSWQKFWQFFIAGAILQSIVALTQFFTQKWLGLKFLAESPLASDLAGVAKIVVNGEKIVRAYGLVPHPNILAAILVTAIFGLAFLFVKAYSVGHPESPAGGEEYRKNPLGYALGMTKIKLFTFAAIFVLLLTALALTFSRTIIIVGLALFVCWLIIIYRNKEYKKTALKVLLVLFLVSCFLFFVFLPYFSARFNLQNIGDSQSFNLRVFYGEVALKLIKENPLLGAGFSNFIPVFGQFYTNLPIWTFQPVHNIYLLIAAETGMLGLLAFLWFLFLTLKSAWPRRRNLSVSCLLFLIFCLLLIGLFDHFLWDIQQGQILFWLLLGILASHSAKLARE